MAVQPAIPIFQDGANGPGYNAVAVVYAAGVYDIPFICRGIYVGTAGHVKVLMANESNAATYVTFKNVPAGTLLPIRARQIVDLTGSAADMVAVG